MEGKKPRNRYILSVPVKILAPCTCMITCAIRGCYELAAYFVIYGLHAARVIARTTLAPRTRIHVVFRWGRRRGKSFLSRLHHMRVISGHVTINSLICFFLYDDRALRDKKLCYHWSIASSVTEKCCIRSLFSFSFLQTRHIVRC